MALTYRGERTVGELNNDLGGFVKDSAFRIYDHGILLKGDVPVRHGDFVSWTGTQWKIEPSLEFATNADVEAVEEKVEALGQPLQWKGPATVQELNDGIEGIQPGWTYTLTDAGTLTDGSVKVDVGDEVAWTEDDEWFKLGGEGGTKVFQVRYSTDINDYIYPAFSDISTAVTAGKIPVIIQYVYSSPVKRCFVLKSISAGYAEFENNDRYITISSADVTTTGYLPQPNIAPEFSEEGSYVVGDLVIHEGKLYRSLAVQSAVVWDDNSWAETSVADQIGNVEAKIGSVKNGGALTSAASVDVPNNACSTLSTSEASLTLNVDVDDGEVPNFAVEITAGANITLTVTKTVESTTTTLNYSAAAGNTLESGKLYQVTCVGSCWTLAEFTAPTP